MERMYVFHFVGENLNRLSIETRIVKTVEQMSADARLTPSRQEIRTDSTFGDKGCGT